MNQPNTLDEALRYIEHLKMLLAYTVKEADGWYDECRGAGLIEHPLMDEAREIVGQDI